MIQPWLFFIVFMLFLLFRQCRLNHKRTFHALFLKLASDLICIPDAAMELIRIGRTAAAAIKSGKAVPAFFLGIHTAALKFCTNFGMLYTLIDIAEIIFRSAHKLMARIQITARRYRQILGS